MGLSKTDYAKYQFMVLVLRALFVLLAKVVVGTRFSFESVDELIQKINEHTRYLENFMKEE